MHSLSAQPPLVPLDLYLRIGKQYEKKFWCTRILEAPTTLRGRSVKPQCYKVVRLGENFVISRIPLEFTKFTT